VQLSLDTKQAWRYVRRSIHVAAAAVVLLVLLEFHGAFVRATMTLFGVRSDTAMILSVTDGCGKTVLVPRALRGLKEDPSALNADNCPTRRAHVVAATAATSLAGSTRLFVNGAVVDTDTGPGYARIALGDVVLRPGVNHIAVFDGSAELLYPNAWRRPFNLLEILLSEEEPVTALLPQGLAATRVSIGAVRDAGGTDVERRLNLGRADNGDLTVAANACLAPEHRFVGWAKAGELRAPEFVLGLFRLLTWTRPIPVTDPLWKTPLAVTVAAGKTGSGACVVLSTSFVVPSGEFYILRDSTFLSRQRDELVLEGFGDAVNQGGMAPVESDGRRRVWRGEPGASGPWIMSSSEAFTEAFLEVPAGREVGEAQEPTAEAEATSETEATKRNEGLFAAVHELSKNLPRVMAATLWGLAAAAPVALVFWTLGLHRRESPAPEQIDRSRASVFALLVFMVAFGLHPLLLELTRLVIRWLSLEMVITDPVGPSWDPRFSDPRLWQRVGNQLYAPLAVVVVLMLVPVLRSGETPAPSRTGPWATRMEAFGALVFTGLGALLLLGERVAVSPRLRGEELTEFAPALLPVFDGAQGTLAALGIVVAGWALIGLLGIWLAASWLFSLIVPQGALRRSAFGAALVIFTLPLIVPVTHVLQVALTLGAMARSLAAVLALVSVARLLSAVAPMVTVGVVVIMTLRGFREVAAEMLPADRATRFRGWVRSEYLVLLTLVIVFPLAGEFSTTETINATILRLMSLFQAYGAILALLALLAAAEMIEAARAGSAAFELPPTASLLAAAAFAGYLTMWSREPVSVLTVMVIGWMLFRYALLGSGDEPTVATTPDGLAKRLLGFRGETRLLDSRRAALDKGFAEGRLASAELDAGREEIRTLENRTRDALGMNAAAAKRTLLERGPGGSPMANGLRGAVAGLGVAIVFQLVLPFDLAAAAKGSSAGWLSLASKIVIDPGYQIVQRGGEDARLLALLNESLNAFAIWVIAGFLFGYLFHRIRGDDGFVKAAVFGAGVAIPYLVTQALLAEGAGVSPAVLMRVVPLLVFLLAAGALVFDGATLRREGLGLARLPDIYGLKTSVGYVSFAGALATIQPLLHFLDWLSGSH
jgi:hypothetical protein